MPQPNSDHSDCGNGKTRLYIPLNITAYAAIILWVVSTIFQVGALYGNEKSKEYTDIRIERLRLEMKQDIGTLNSKLDQVLSALQTRSAKKEE